MSVVPAESSRGSSPLARGLRPWLSAVSFALGIIPARAGFTTPYSVGNPLFWDHPRSRGVYHLVSHVDSLFEGSSPLARGLRRARHRCSCEFRIIPARAGFTTHPCTSSPTARDHPRSRGVYHEHHGLTIPRQGSSPLARGLLALVRFAGRGRGIIPARAGFTKGGGGTTP